MDIVLSVLGITGTMMLGVMSPGPCFVMIARTAVAVSRRDGLAASLGMGVGGALYAMAAVGGLQAVFAAVPSLYIGVKAIGGAYLAYLGFRIWRGASTPMALADPASAQEARPSRRSFMLGLVTQLSNPKTAVIYASVFAAFLPHDVPLALALSLPVVMFVIETGWYAVVALVLSSEGPRLKYLRFRAWIDRTAGGLMMILGAKLILSAREA